MVPRGRTAWWEGEILSVHNRRDDAGVVLRRPKGEVVSGRHPMAPGPKSMAGSRATWKVAETDGVSYMAGMIAGAAYHEAFPEDKVMREFFSLSVLWRYPVKSLRGQRCERLVIGSRGPVHDREWMLVDEGGRFLTQRQQSRMAQIDVALEDDDLVFHAPGRSPLRVARSGIGDRLSVQVWNDCLEAQGMDPAADAWLSDFLGQPCRLVHFPEDVRRPVDPRYAQADDQVGFADGFPLLLISQAALDALNLRLDEPVEMRRFRPNLVVSGCAPHAEDDWRRIRIGGLTFRVAKPCSRCPIPGLDPETGEKRGRVLETLMSYRRGEDNKLYFGQNLLHDGTGDLVVGMPVEVLE